MLELIQRGIQQGQAPLILGIITSGPEHGGTF
jgi:hypothetical protein